MKTSKIAENEKLITFKSVSKNFNGFLALDNISLEINKGDVFGFIGPNGAGKTTTIKILVGLIKDFKGKVQIDGLTMPKNSNQVGKLIGYLPQHVSFQEWRTVNHALETFGMLSGLEKTEMENQIVQVLKLLNISEVRFKKINQLSGGTVQKVGIAQALLHNPKILIFDEPLNGLDPESRFFIKNIIKNLSEKGITVFFSSHILTDVQDVATQIGILNNGRIMKIGSIQDLITDFPFNNNIDFEVSVNTPDLREIENIEGVTTIERNSSNRFRVHTTKDSELNEIINRITQRLLDSNCKIRSINTVNSNLDEIYLKYVRGDIQ